MFTSYILSIIVDSNEI